MIKLLDKIFGLKDLKIRRIAIFLTHHRIVRIDDKLWKYNKGYWKLHPKGLSYNDYALAETIYSLDMKLEYARVEDLVSSEGKDK